MEADLFIRGRELQDTNLRMQQVNAEPAAASAALRVQQQAKDRSIATLSHELRNPLTSARAALDTPAGRHRQPGTLRPVQRHRLDLGYPDTF